MVKQTVIILSVLVLALLAASGFIAASNVDLCENLAYAQKQTADLRAELSEKVKQLDQSMQENRQAAETLQKTTLERDALSQQLNDAVLSSQEANDALAVQISQNKQQLLQLELLEKDYRELSQACTALEARIEELSVQTAAAASLSQQQALADAERIAQLEAELQAALEAAPEVPLIPHAVPPAV